VDRVLGAAQITSLLPDTGYPYWKKVTVEDCARVVTRRPLYEVFRVESAFRSRNSIYLEDTSLSFDKYVERYRAVCVDAVKKRGCVAMKTVIAYRTGLAIQQVAHGDAKAAFAANPDIDLRAQKIVRDYLFRYTAQLAGELGVPFVLHTGFTALTKPWSYGNPTDLSPILTDLDVQDTVFVLLHGGYPWNSAAGFIAAHHPNVYLDLSEFNPATSIGIEHNFREVLQFAPLSKITFGSDGLGIPELFWYAAVQAKRAMGNILEEFVRERLMRPEQAENHAAQFFHGTAKKIYRLPDQAIQRDSRGFGRDESELG
jgi:predicted TIM-barrel fold metal-dependent hydrolase